MNRLYAMDTFFYNSLGAYPFDVRCAMLRELGYDAAYLTLWNERAWADAARLPAVRDEYGLDVEAVYAVLDIGRPPDDPEAGRLTALLGRLQGGARVELALTAESAGCAPSDPAGDERAAAWLGRLLALAERRGIRLSLYPHFAYWMERWQDALRLVDRLGHPLLGIALGSFHWYAVDGTRPDAALSACAPHLHAVNLCGSRRLPGASGMPATIELIDEGELDLFAFVRALASVGYEGPVGLQGYGIGGDVYANLERSKRAYERLSARVREHPEWELA